MRAVLQRVISSKLLIKDKVFSKIGRGILAFVCICRGDTEKDLEYVAKKLVNMRIFSDKEGKFNLSLKDTGGQCMIISQFTLAADTKKGNRPSYFYAEEPDKAVGMYERFITLVENTSVEVKKGVFGASMKIELINDGPVTICIDSKEKRI